MPILVPWDCFAFKNEYLSSACVQVQYDVIREAWNNQYQPCSSAFVLPSLTRADEKHEGHCDINMSFE